MIKYIWFPPFIKYFVGITLYPFIFINMDYKDYKFINKLLNHEKIHIEQQKELFIFLFYILYILNWLLNILLYKFDLKKSYKNIIFEIEAYTEEHDPNYIRYRNKHNWLNYFNKREII